MLQMTYIFGPSIVFVCELFFQPTNYICGDDGVTYSSYCEFKRQQCRQNKKVSIKSKGPCNNACRQKREDAIYQQATGFIAKGYVPAVSFTATVSLFCQDIQNSIV